MHPNPEPFIPALPSSGRASLPALIEALPPDDARPAQTQFTRARQAAFLKRLADTGEVRVAARASAVSHQCAYRMRRACRVFRHGWDAALLIAREKAEEALASRALHGVEEEVYYHGEVVATRRRYDSRLLLAHLARLDRMAEREDVSALAESFDAVIAAFETCGDEGGEGQPASQPQEMLDLTEVVLPEINGPAEAETRTSSHAGDKTTPGPCNMRSMSRAAKAGEEREDEPEDEPENELKDGVSEGALERRLQAMEAARPESVPEPGHRARSVGDAGAIEAAQLAAFEAGEPRWWLIGLEEPGTGRS